MWRNNLILFTILSYSWQTKLLRTWFSQVFIFLSEAFSFCPKVYVAKFFWKFFGQTIRINIKIHWTDVVIIYVSEFLFWILLILILDRKGPIRLTLNIIRFWLEFRFKDFFIFWRFLHDAVVNFAITIKI